MPSVIFRLIVVAALLLAPGLANAVLDEACTCNSTFDWSAIGTTSPAGQWDGCTPSSLDSFEIQSGCNVTITGDITWASDAEPFLQCESGGSLTIVTTGASDSSITITLPGGSLNADADESMKQGLDIESGCVFTVTSGWRQFYDATPINQTNPSYFFTGDYIPCDNQNCATTANIAEFSYPFGRYSGGPGDRLEIEAAITAIDADDVLWFLDPDLTDKFANHDTLSPYEITTIDPNTGGTAFIKMDTRQGEATYDNYPLARRDIFSATLSAAVNKGDRKLTVPAGTWASGDVRHPIGHWLRCGGSGPVADTDTAVRIQSVTDGGAGVDTILLASLKGMYRDCASGDTVFIDPGGWVAGDTFGVMVPVRFTSATAETNDTSIMLEGTINISGVVFDNINRVFLRGVSTAPTFEYVWSKDQAGYDGDSGGESARPDWLGNIAIEDIATGSDIGPIAITGGTNLVAANVEDSFHGITLQGSPNINIHDVMCRHGEDDCFVMRDDDEGDSAVLASVDIATDVFTTAAPHGLSPGDLITVIYVAGQMTTVPSVADQRMTVLATPGASTLTFDDGTGVTLDITAKTAGIGIYYEFPPGYSTDSGIAPTNPTLRRWRCQYIADNAESRNCIQLFWSGVGGTLADIESVNAGTTAGGKVVTSSDSLLSFDISGLLILNDNGGLASGGGNDNRQFNNLTSIGATISTLTGASYNGFVFREPGTTTSWTFPAPSHVSITNGIFRDIANPITKAWLPLAIEMAEPFTMKNVVFWNFSDADYTSCGDTCGAIAIDFESLTNEATIENVTFYWDDNFSGEVYAGINIREIDTGTLNMGSVLFAGYKHQDLADANHPALLLDTGHVGGTPNDPNANQINVTGPICFWQTDFAATDGTDDVTGAPGWGGNLTYLSLGWADAAHADFTQARGSTAQTGACGARPDAGVFQRQLYHSWSGLEPEFWGQVTGGGGHAIQGSPF